MAKDGQDYKAFYTEAERRLRPKLTFPGLADPRYAVLIPIVCGENGAELLLEVRAAGISQSGDPCFPGGHIEGGETPERAALRETEEELGISAERISVRGQLPTVQTPLGQHTDVFVGLLPASAEERLKTNPAEVAEVLRVPLEFFLKRRNASSFPFGGHVIWGMTAGAIRHLCGAWGEDDSKNSGI